MTIVTVSWCSHRFTFRIKNNVCIEKNRKRLFSLHSNGKEQVKLFFEKINFIREKAKKLETYIKCSPKAPWRRATFAECSGQAYEALDLVTAVRIRPGLKQLYTSNMMDGGFGVVSYMTFTTSRISLVILCWILERTSNFFHLRKFSSCSYLFH